MTNGNGNGTPAMSPASLGAKPKRKYTRRAKETGPIKIEKGIPLPPPTSMQKYPWAAMEVNDSFFVPNGPKSLFGTCSKRSKEGPNAYTARNVEQRGVKGVRVWRTK